MENVLYYIDLDGMVVEEVERGVKDFEKSVMEKVKVLDEGCSDWCVELEDDKWILFVDGCLVGWYSIIKE